MNMSMCIYIYIYMIYYINENIDTLYIWYNTRHMNMSMCIYCIRILYYIQYNIQYNIDIDVTRLEYFELCDRA